MDYELSANLVVDREAPGGGEAEGASQLNHLEGGKCDS